MGRFIVARALHTLLILVGVSLVAFALIHMIPGNPLDILLPPEAPKTVVDQLRSEFGSIVRFTFNTCPGSAVSCTATLESRCSQGGKSRTSCCVRSAIR